MPAKCSGSGLFVSLWGAAGVFIVGFFGSEALFAPGAEGVALEATLLPSVAAAAGAFIYLLVRPEEDSAVHGGEAGPLPPVANIEAATVPAGREAERQAA